MLRTRDKGQMRGRCSTIRGNWAHTLSEENLAWYFYEHMPSENLENLSYPQSVKIVAFLHPIQASLSSYQVIPHLAKGELIWRTFVWV